MAMSASTSMVPLFPALVMTVLLLECSCSVPGCSRRSPVGVKMCKSLCRNTFTCRAPVYLQQHLTCYLHGEEEHTKLVGAVTLDVAQNSTIEGKTCQRDSMIIYARNRQVQCIKCAHSLPQDSAMIVAYNSTWFYYVIKHGSCVHISKWSEQPEGMTVDHHAKIICWLNNNHTLGISPISNISQKTSLFYEQSIEPTSYFYDATSKVLLFTQGYSFFLVKTGSIIGKSALSVNVEITDSTLSSSQRFMFFAGRPKGTNGQENFKILKVDYEIHLLQQKNTSCITVSGMTFDDKDGNLYFLCVRQDHALVAQYVAIDSDLSTDITTLYTLRKDQSSFLQSEDQIYVIGLYSFEVYDRRMNFKYNTTGCVSGKIDPIWRAHYLGAE